MNVEITPYKPKPYMGREVFIEKEFQVEGSFKSMYAANKWCHDNGFDYGSGCVMQPTAITKGEYIDSRLPEKWRNFTDKQKRSVAGIMTGDERNGPVYVRIFV